MVRLGLIGCGMAVQRLHWPVLKQLRREVKVVALARKDHKEAEAIAARENIGRVYADYKELLQDRDVDAVLIAVPIALNGTVLLDSLAANKHVMAEKPIAASLKEARSIVQETEKCRRQIVLIGENFRYRRSLVKAKELIDSDRIGKVFSFQLKVNFDITSKARQPWISRNWRHKASHLGGFILDAGVHPVAALRDVLGEVDRVWARTLDVSDVLNGPDSLLMQVQMKSGVTGQCFFCYTAKEYPENGLDFAIYGTEGVLRVGHGILAVSSGADPRVQTFQTKDREYVGQWKNFCASIRGEERVLSTTRAAYGDLAVIDAALRSSVNAQPCSVHALR